MKFFSRLWQKYKRASKTTWINSWTIERIDRSIKQMFRVNLQCCPSVLDIWKYTKWHWNYLCLILNCTLFQMLPINNFFFLFLFHLFLFNCNNAVRCVKENILIHTKLGVIMGSLMKTRLGKDIYAFRGIPYAEAPTGPRRFKVILQFFCCKYTISCTLKFEFEFHGINKMIKS